MLWTIVKKETLDNLMRLRFSLGFLLLIMLFAMNGLVFVRGYARDVEEYQRVTQKNTEDLRKNSMHINDLAFSYQRIRIRPSVLGFCARGYEKKGIPNVAVINAFGMKEGMEVETYISLFLERFKEIDWMFIIGVVASLVAFVLTYDSISGEKEMHTIGLMMANPLPRSVVLFGKYLAALLCLWTSVLIGSILNVIIISASDYASFATEEMTRIGLIAFTCLIYLSAFVWIGLFISGRTRSSSVSLVFLLAFWVIVVIFIPGSGGLLASKLYKIPTRRQIKVQVSLAEKDVRQKYDKDRTRRASATMTNEMWSRTNRIYEDYRRKMISQIQWTQSILRISPTAGLQYACEAIATRDVGDYRAFLHRVRQYRDQLRKFIEAEDAKDGDSAHLVSPLSPDAFSSKKVSFDAIPKFVPKRGSVTLSLESAIWDILVLFLFNAVFAMLAYLAFIRYDVS